jgi:hypothetical protein
MHSYHGVPFAEARLQHTKLDVISNRMLARGYWLRQQHSQVKIGHLLAPVVWF